MESSKCEYGATSAKGQNVSGSNRQNVFITIFASTIVLAVIALAQSPFPGAFVLAEAAPEQEIAGHSVASQIVLKHAVPSIPEVSAAAHALVSQPLKKYIAAKKQAKILEHFKSPNHAQAVSHIPAAAIKSIRAPLSVHAEKHAVEMQRTETQPTIAPLVVSAKSEAVRSHLAKGKMLDSVDDAATPSDSTSSDSPSPNAAAVPAAEPTEIFHSPVGDLKPTGIMSVFFNENIMITAVCVIAFLLLAICCFARNADCALS